MSSDEFNASRRRAILLLSLCIACAFISCFIIRQWLGKSANPQESSCPLPALKERIITLSPSCAEIIYQLHGENSLIGISRFCKYPPEINKKPVVGGYLDLKIETVVALRADCVLLLKAQDALVPQLKSHGIHTVVIEHSSIRGIIDSVATVGAILNKQREAAVIIRTMEQKVLKVSVHGRGMPRTPRVLICLDRDTDAEHPERVVVAGRGSIHQEFVNACGGENAYDGSIAYPLISRESLMRMDPDIIIDIVRNDDWDSRGESALLGQWSAYPELKAVRNKRVVLIHENQHMIPGPRFTETLDIFARIIQSTS